MTSTYQRQLSFVIIIYVIFLWTIKAVNTFDYVHPRINQKVLIGPHAIYAHPGETVQFPCVVSKQFDATVTWCWNDFCTLGKAQLVRHEATHSGLISVYQYTAYPKFRLHINERLNHYNLSIIDVSDKDEGIFQCQIQRTMRANEARSERAHLTIISPPIDQPKLLLPNMPLKQGHSANITCMSSSSKPASKLILYKDEEILTSEFTSSKYVYEFDKDANKYFTKLIYTIDDPDSSWHNSIIKCKQVYEYAKNLQFDVTARLHVHYKPKARIESQNRYPLTVNSTATFRCIVHGNPEPQFKWFANSIDLKSLSSPIINIPLSKHVHNHSIGCTAINSVGMTNTSVRLLVRYPPTFVIRPPNFVVLDLDSKSLSKPTVVRCLVDSYPRAKITWYRYGEILAEGSLFNLARITKRDQQGIYSYRVESEGFETIKNDFVIYIKGKPLIYIQESRQYNRLFECQVYSSSPILKITWRLNDQPIESSDQLFISTKCNNYSCISTLTYNYPRVIPPSKVFNRLSCIGENEFGVEQSRLYQMNTSDDPTIILLSILLSTFILIIVFSIIAIYCCCRVRRIRKRQEHYNNKKLPIVYDEHYSINELIKEVGSLKTCNPAINNSEKLSLQMDPTDHLLTTPLNNSNTRTVLDNLSNESSTNSSGFHSKSTTTLFNNEYSPRLPETVDLAFSGIPQLYTYHIK